MNDLRVVKDVIDYRTAVVETEEAWQNMLAASRRQADDEEMKRLIIIFKQCLLRKSDALTTFINRSVYAQLQREVITTT